MGLGSSVSRSERGYEREEEGGGEERGGDELVLPVSSLSILASCLGDGFLQEPKSTPLDEITFME